MKVVFTLLLSGIVFCAATQTDLLQTGVYSYSKNTDIKIGNVKKRAILAGKTLDLQFFEIYTLTLGAGQTYIPPAGDSRFEQLIIVKSGIVTLTLNDSTKTVGTGSLALVLAGDKIAFNNTSGAPASWFVLNYCSKNPADIPRGHGAGPSFIKDWNLLPVKSAPYGEARAVFDRPTSMFERFDVHSTTLNPGFASHPPHTHRAEELILMLGGDIQEQIDQVKFNAHVGDCIFLSSEILHGVKNVSDHQCYYFAIQWHNLKTD